MKTKRLFNTSAYKTSMILERVLSGSGCRVYPELPLSLVLDIEGDSLSRQERKTFNTGSFDFVVYNEESFPEFAVEFDGPDHQIYEKTKQADIRKNLLCCKARLPLLRINDDFLSEYEKCSVLEYMVGRFVDWKNEREGIAREESEISEHLAARGATEEEYEQVMDPQIMWDLEHPFPASIQIAQRLYSTFGVVINHIDAEMYEKAMDQSEFLFFHRKTAGSAPVGLYHYKIDSRYELERRSRGHSGGYQNEQINLVTVGVTYQWRLPTVDLTRIDTSKELIVEYAHGQELPGISCEELANHFCDFLALNQLETWAEQNLRRFGF
ncbi:MAG TPA: DUF2726 domain-containing protein [Anaerolineales bacterium]|nr:DUF2726 domain-containing protein [Anaerolineales bacterium]